MSHYWFAYIAMIVGIVLFCVLFADRLASRRLEVTEGLIFSSRGCWTVCACGVVLILGSNLYLLSASEGKAELEKRTEHFPPEVIDSLERSLDDGYLSERDAITINHWMNVSVRSKKRSVVFSVRKDYTERPDEAIGTAANGAQMADAERAALLAWIIHQPVDRVPEEIRRLIISAGSGVILDRRERKSLAYWAISANIRGSGVEWAPEDSWYRAILPGDPRESLPMDYAPAPPPPPAP